MVNLFYNRNNFTLISKALCTSQAFVCLSSHLSLALHLGVNICGRFNAASIKYLLHFTRHATAQDHRFFCRTILQMCRKISQQRHNALTTRINKFFCCLYSVKIVSIRSDSILKNRLFFAKCFHFCRCNGLDKRPLFVTYFMSFKPEQKSSCNLFW